MVFQLQKKKVGNISNCHKKSIVSTLLDLIIVHNVLSFFSTVIFTGDPSKNRLD